eukprot:6199923-Pleurochrysis_carterae.AAC.3
MQCPHKHVCSHPRAPVRAWRRAIVQAYVRSERMLAHAQTIKHAHSCTYQLHGSQPPRTCTDGCASRCSLHVQARKCAHGYSTHASAYVHEANVLILHVTFSSSYFREQSQAAVD